MAFLKAAIGSASPPSAIMIAGGSWTIIGGITGMGGRVGAGKTIGSTGSGCMSSKIGGGTTMSSSPKERSPCRSSVGSNRDLVSSNSSMEVSVSEGGGLLSPAGNRLVSMGNSGFPLSARFFY